MSNRGIEAARQELEYIRAAAWTSNDEGIRQAASRAMEALQSSMDCPVCGEDHEGNVPLGCATGDGV